MHYADIKKIDIANGEGVRVSLFVSGCRHHCKGCFNEIAWNFKYGKEFTQDTVDEIIKDLDHDYVKVKEKYPNKNIWCYTGFDFEKDIMPECKTSAVTKQLISNIDVIVDGKFDESKMDRKLKFRGSSNQRIIDVKETLHDNAIKMVKFTD